MTILEPTVAAPRTGLAGYLPIHWSAIIAGAIAAAGLSFVLHSFAAAIGLAVSSTAPTWRDSSSALQVLSGLYLVLVAIVAFGVGGYLAGRLCQPRAGAAEEIAFRDGTHGIIMWAIALVITVFMAWATTQS